MHLWRLVLQQYLCHLKLKGNRLFEQSTYQSDFLNSKFISPWQFVSEIWKDFKFPSAVILFNYLIYPEKQSFFLSLLWNELIESVSSQYWGEIREVAK